MNHTINNFVYNKKKEKQEMFARDNHDFPSKKQRDFWSHKTESILYIL